MLPPPLAPSRLPAPAAAALAVLLAVAGPAWADEGSSLGPTTGEGSAHAPPPTAPPGAAERLESAVRSYHSGQHDLALSLLTALVRDAPGDLEVVRSARVFMGEIFLVQGNEAAARDAFELVLAQDPELELDPFVHPPDICAFFELVKASLARQPEVALVLPPPVIIPERPSPWLPLGLAQTRQERPVPGAMLALGQGATCLASAGLFAWLALDRRHGSQDQPGFDDEGHRLWTLDTLESRRTAQWTLTGLCYGSYAIGVADAALAERRYRRRAAAARTDPPAAPTLVVRGTF